MSMKIGMTFPNNKAKEQFQLTRKIGSGGFGEVFEGINKKSNEKVAIKIFRENSSVSTNDFIREAEQATRVGGKNVIKTYGIFDAEVDDEKIHYLLMEYAEGGSLREMLNNYQTENFIPIANILDIANQCLLGLKDVHKKLLHRDIKPENFLFVAKTLKISDFGLSKIIDESTRTKTYKGWGTCRYMAPESWSLGKMSPATDIYSVGILLYELATLNPPYLSEDISELEQMHRFAPIPNIRDVNKEVPIGLEGIIKKAMQKDPQSRYQNAEEMLSDLEKVTAEPTDSSKISEILDVANKIYTKEEEEKNKRNEKERHSAMVMSKNQYKINEFIEGVQKVIDNFNQNFPQEKIWISKGSDTDYSVIWKRSDLLRFRFNPHIFSMSLDIQGNKLAAYGYVEISKGNENEGLNFILVGQTDDTAYGNWKILDISGSVLVPRMPHYSVAVELDVIERISKMGNAMDIWQQQIREITNFDEEIINLIKRSMESFENPPQKQDLTNPIEYDIENDW